MAPVVDPVSSIAEFIEFVARSAMSRRQRSRIAKAAKAPITGAELSALRALATDPSVTVTALAERVGLDRTTVSRIVGRLEDLELVERTGDDRDRRRAWLDTSPTGQRLLADLDRVSHRDFEVATGEWSETDRAQLGQLLSRLREDLQRLTFDADGWAAHLGPAGDDVEDAASNLNGRLLP